MHRYCTTWNSCQRSLIAKDATLSHVLDLWKNASHPASINTMHCQQVSKPKSLSINHQICHNRGIIRARSNLLISSHVSCASLLQSSFVLAQQNRFIHLPIPFKKKQDLRALDKIPRDFECIYSTSLHVYIAYFYPLITITTLGGLIPLGLEVFINGSLNLPSSYTFFFDNSLQIVMTLPFAVGLACISKYFASRCPVRIYVNENDEFIAVFATMFPWRTSKSLWHACSIQSLTPVHDEKATLWTNLRGSHIVNNRRMIILPYAFKYPHYYNVLLGNTLEHIQEKDDKFLE